MRRWSNRSLPVKAQKEWLRIRERINTLCCVICEKDYPERKHKHKRGQMLEKRTIGVFFSFFIFYFFFVYSLFFPWRFVGLVALAFAVWNHLYFYFKKNKEKKWKNWTFSFYYSKLAANITGGCSNANDFPIIIDLVASREQACYSHISNGTSIHRIHRPNELQKLTKINYRWFGLVRFNFIFQKLI